MSLLDPIHRQSHSQAHTPSYATCLQLRPSALAAAAAVIDQSKEVAPSSQSLLHHTDTCIACLCSVVIISSGSIVNHCQQSLLSTRSRKRHAATAGQAPHEPYLRSDSSTHTRTVTHVAWGHDFDVISCTHAWLLRGGKPRKHTHAVVAFWHINSTDLLLLFTSPPLTLT